MQLWHLFKSFFFYCYKQSKDIIKQLPQNQLSKKDVQSLLQVIYTKSEMT